MREQETNSQENRNCEEADPTEYSTYYKASNIKIVSFCCNNKQNCEKNFNSEVDSIAYENLVCAKGSISNL